MSDLYQTKEWKSLPLMERAYMLPAMEGIRKGCLINTKNISNISDLEYCLNQKGLKYRKKGNAWLASKDETLLENVVRKWESFYAASHFQGIDYDADKIIKQIGKEYHKAIGKFFGYPKCCIKKFIKYFLKVSYPNSKWHKKAGKALSKGRYNDLFNYALHIPCGPGCKESLKTAESVKKCLETYDSEAAEAFRKAGRISIERAAEKCTTT